MSNVPNDPSFDPAQSEEDGTDPDTSLILDYLSNKLDPDAVHQLEDRARSDKDFRYKLADIVLLKGLVMLALEKNPGPSSAECRRAQRLFVDYIKGRTSAKKTGLLSRHLEECFECELAFERFQAQPAAVTEDGGSPAGIRGRLSKARGVVYTAIVAVALAAGAFGVVGILSSGGAAPRSRPAAVETGGTDGLVARPAEILAALDAATANADPGLATDQLKDLVQQILEGQKNAMQRGDVYREIGRDFRSSAEHLLWVLAANESDDTCRTSLYVSLISGAIADEKSFEAAVRRELDQRNLNAIPLLVYASEHQRRLLEAAFARDQKKDELWSQLIRLYPRVAGSPAAERHIAAVLADPRDSVRSFGILARSDAGNAEALPLALGLLESEDAVAQQNAAVVIARQGSQNDVDRLVARPWAKKTKQAIVAQFKNRSSALPPVELPPDF